MILRVSVPVMASVISARNSTHSLGVLHLLTVKPSLMQVLLMACSKASRSKARPHQPAKNVFEVVYSKMKVIISTKTFHSSRMALRLVTDVDCIKFLFFGH